MGSRPATPRKNVKYTKCQNASDRRRSRCLGVSPSAPGPRRRSRLRLFSAAAAEPGEASAPPRDPPRRTIWNRRPTTVRRTLPGLHETRGTWWLLPGHCFLTSAKSSTDLTVGDLTCHQTRRGRRPAPSTAAAGLLRCGDAPRPAPGGGRASPRGAPGATSSHFSCLQSAVGRPVPFTSRDELGDEHGRRQRVCLGAERTGDPRGKRAIGS